MKKWWIILYTSGSTKIGDLIYEGYEVVRAEDTLEALRIGRKFRPMYHDAERVFGPFDLKPKGV